MKYLSAEARFIFLATLFGVAWIAFIVYTK
jgi:hypothetical protein